MRHRFASFLVAIGAAGCLTASGSTTPEQVPPPRPLDGAVMFTAAETKLLHDASEVLVRNCMTARGLRYQQVPGTDRNKSSAANPYGLLDPTTVGADGYGMTSEFLGAGQAQPADPNDPVIASMTDAEQQEWRTALTGSAANHQPLSMPDGTMLTIPSDGCVAEASSELYGAAWDRLYLTFQGYANLVLSRTEQDAAYRQGITAWSECMSEAGYRYQSLQDPRREINQLLEKAPPPAEPGLTGELRQIALTELAVARADAGCERDTGLNEAVTIAQRTTEAATLTPQIRADLETLWSMRRTALDHAQQIAA